MMDEPPWRTLSMGRCFVYILPCREEDTLKMGYARDPWARMQTLHPRFHAFFDLDRAVLLETDRVREARAVEKNLKSAFAMAQVLAPTQIRQRAAGRFEWFRGVHPAAIDALQAASVALGYPLHAPLSAWLRGQWLPQSERVGDWIKHEFEQIEAWHFNADAALADARERALRNRIDAWESIGLALEERLGNNVRHWYRYGFDE